MVLVKLWPKKSVTRLRYCIVSKCAQNMMPQKKEHLLSFKSELLFSSAIRLLTIIIEIFLQLNVLEICRVAKGYNLS